MYANIVLSVVEYSVIALNKNCAYTIKRDRIPFPLQPHSSVLYRCLILKCSVIALLHLSLRLVYKSSIALSTLYTLFIVSNSAVSFSARLLLTERLNFQSEL
jgi:hypothetical protein